MASAWYYQSNGEQSGPITTPELKALAANGGLVPSDLVWKEGLEEWLPASSLSGMPFIPGATALNSDIPREKLSWLDQQLIQTSWVALIALCVLFFGLMLIFSTIALIISKNPAARKKAKILFAICFGYVAVAMIFVFAIALFAK